MKYTPLSQSTNGESVTTTVAYTFSDGSQKTIDVIHFRPDSPAEIHTDIVSRGQTEEARIAAVQVVAAAVADFSASLNIEVTV